MSALRRSVDVVAGALRRRPDTATAAVIAAIGIAFAALGVHHLWGSMFGILADGSGAWWSLVTVVPGCILVAAKRRAPLSALICGSALFALDVVTVGSVGMLLVLVDLLYTASATAGPRRRRGLLVAILLVSGGLTGIVLAGTGEPAMAALMALQTLGILGSSYWWATAVARASELAELHRRHAADLGRLTELRREEAVRGERERMAQELHDVVAGHVGAVAIRSEAALGGAGHDADSLRAIRESSLRAHDALGSMITVLRTGAEHLTTPPRLSDPAGLVGEARAGGLEVELRLEELPPLADSVDQTAGRILQEALANAVRHGAGGRAEVSASVNGDALRLVVDSVASGPSGSGIPGTGLGLTLMGERARALGGTVRAGPVPHGPGARDGWRVEADLPVDVEAVGPAAAATAAT